MSKLPYDELSEILDSEVRHAVSKERERCAKLCEMLAAIQERSAACIRAKGVKWTWLKPTPSYEKCALELEEVAKGHRTVAHCIRMGYDPDKVDERERNAEKINLMQQEMTPAQKADLLRRMPGLQ
jgi:hypothetical protein